MHFELSSEDASTEAVCCNKCTHYVGDAVSLWSGKSVREPSATSLPSCYDPKTALKSKLWLVIVVHIHNSAVE